MTQDDTFGLSRFLGIFLLLLFAVYTVKGVTCKDCQDVDNPANCNVSRACGNEEICSTEEYIDVKGDLLYRQGCESAARCRLFVDAKTLFGKREISRRCYECCEKDDCNANLCQSSGGHVTTTPLSHPTNPSSGCPRQYVPFNDKCYFMSPSAVEWRTANTYCRHVGNLVSLNSKEEHDFLLGLSVELNAGFTTAFWTGGFYTPDSGKFQYTDGSLFNYTHWFHDIPGISHGHVGYEALLNPPRSSNNKDLPVMKLPNTSKLGFICEIDRN